MSQNICAETLGGKLELDSIRIQKYRSILSVTDIALDGLTVLIGPNNQGKSNILQAIRLGMETISLSQTRLRESPDTNLPTMVHAPRRRSAFILNRQPRTTAARYDWLRDFPAQLRHDKRAKQASVLRFNFSLDETERSIFRQRTKARNNGKLSVEITFTEDNISVDFPKPGGSGSYRKVAREICSFIEDNFTFLYVPAIRTADQAIEVISELITDRLATLAKMTSTGTLSRVLMRSTNITPVIFPTQLASASTNICKVRAIYPYRCRAAEFL